MTETVVTGEAPVIEPGVTPTVETKVEPKEAGSPPAKPEGDDTPDWALKRFGELTKSRRETERDRDYWRELAMRAPPAPSPQAQTEKPKTLADFSFDESAFARHLIEQAAPKPEVLRQEFSKWQEEQAENNRRAQFAAREAEFEKLHPEYRDVVYSDRVDISKSMADAIYGAEEGPEVALYLAKNPSEASAISRLPAGLAGYELGKVAAKLAAERTKAAKTVVSQAPPPPPKVEGSDPGNVERDPAKMTPKQFAAWRRQYMK